MADPVTGACCAVHAGREGTELFIAVKAVRYLTENFGVRPENIIACLGPAIRNCCYEVDRKPADNFSVLCEIEAAGREKRRIDIVSANIKQITSAGVAKGSILDSSICTSCRHDHFFSYRKDGGVTGRFISAVANTGRLHE
jgi:copper oxidase (laccase) domain-containing protein